MEAEPKPLQRFMCRYWDAEDVWFYFEVDPDCWVTRHIELHGPHRTTAVAASLAEWMHELDAGRIQEYQRRYGVLAEKPLEADELGDWLPVTAGEFEQVWAHARAWVEAS